MKIDLSVKQILLILGVLIVIIIGSGIITNRKPKERQNLNNEQLEQKTESNINRLLKADNHLQRITTPVSVLRREAQTEWLQ